MKINALTVLLVAAVSLFLAITPTLGSTQDAGVTVTQFTTGSGHDSQNVDITVIQTIINDGCNRDGCNHDGCNHDGCNGEDGSASPAGAIVGLKHPDNPFGFQGTPNPIMNFDCSAWHLKQPCPIPMNTAS